MRGGESKSVGAHIVILKRGKSADRWLLGYDLRLRAKLDSLGTPGIPPVPARCEALDAWGGCAGSRDGVLLAKTGMRSRPWPGGRWQV